jgi:hypothetical protein
MRWSLFACLLAITAWNGAAGAVSVTNRDDKAYKVTVIEGDAKQDHTVAPAGVIQGVCLKGCLIRLGDSQNDEYELEGTEIVSIEDGYLYYDGPAVGTETAPGSTTLPPPSDKPPAAQPK